jgi:phosphohistidine phosphatase
MKCYLMRHGSALATDTLSEEGKQEIRKMASFLSHEKVVIDQIYYSKKMRAKETAEIIASLLHKPSIVKEGLGPLDQTTALLEEIETTKETLLVVSHLPFLAQVLSALHLGDQREEFLNLSCGSISALEKTPSGWKLLWIKTPQEVESTTKTI